MYHHAFVEKERVDFWYIFIVCLSLLATTWTVGTRDT